MGTFIVGEEPQYSGSEETRDSTPDESPCFEMIVDNEDQCFDIEVFTPDCFFYGSDAGFETETPPVEGGLVHMSGIYLSGIHVYGDRLYTIGRYSYEDTSNEYRISSYDIRTDHVNAITLSPIDSETTDAYYATDKLNGGHNGSIGDNYVISSDSGKEYNTTSLLSTSTAVYTERYAYNEAFASTFSVSEVCAIPSQGTNPETREDARISTRPLGSPTLTPNVSIRAMWYAVGYYPYSINIADPITPAGFPTPELIGGGEVFPYYYIGSNNNTSVGFNFSGSPEDEAYVSFDVEPQFCRIIQRWRFDGSVNQPHYTSVGGTKSTGMIKLPLSVNFNTQNVSKYFLSDEIFGFQFGFSGGLIYYINIVDYPFEEIVDREFKVIDANEYHPYHNAIDITLYGSVFLISTPDPDNNESSIIHFVRTDELP